MAALTHKDIDWFGIYDCYPICFARSVCPINLASQRIALQSFVSSVFRAKFTHKGYAVPEFL
jgi:hypothetical protein